MGYQETHPFFVSITYETYINSYFYNNIENTVCQYFFAHKMEKIR